MSIRFSIIVPIYNVGPYLRECLDSLLEQSYVEWEAICIDDGSTDDSGVILDDYAKRDRRFRIYHRINAGVGGARNFGLDQAAGDYILFVDGDDILDRAALATVAQNLREGVQIVTFGMTRFYDKDELANRPADECCPGARRIDLSSVPREISSRGLWQCTYANDIVSKIRFKPYVIGEDRLFFLEALDRSASVIDINQPFYRYRTREGSALRSTMTERKMLDDISHDIDMLAIIGASGKKYCEFLRKDLVRGMTQLAYLHYRQLMGNRKMALAEWRGELKRALNLRCVHLIEKIIIRTSILLSQEFVLWILFYLPYRLRNSRALLKLLNITGQLT